MVERKMMMIMATTALKLAPIVLGLVAIGIAADKILKFFNTDLKTLLKNAVDAINKLPDKIVNGLRDGFNDIFNQEEAGNERAQEEMTKINAQYATDVATAKDTGLYTDEQAIKKAQDMRIDSITAQAYQAYSEVGPGGNWVNSEDEAARDLLRQRENYKVRADSAYNALTDDEIRKELEDMRNKTVIRGTKDYSEVHTGKGSSLKAMSANMADRVTTERSKMESTFGGVSYSHGSGQTGNAQQFTGPQKDGNPYGLTTLGSMTPYGIAVHHTAGNSFNGAIQELKSREFGYHYIIDKDGSVKPIVRDNLKLQHLSEVDLKPGVGLNNSNTIGVSLVAEDDRYVTSAQRDAALGLIKTLQAKHKIRDSNVKGHTEIDYRKDDYEGLTVVNAFRGEDRPEYTNAYKKYRKEREGVGDPSPDTTNSGSSLSSSIGVMDGLAPLTSPIYPPPGGGSTPTVIPKDSSQEDDGARNGSVPINPVDFKSEKLQCTPGTTEDRIKSALETAKKAEKTRQEIEASISNNISASNFVAPNYFTENTYISYAVNLEPYC